MYNKYLILWILPLLLCLYYGGKSQSKNFIDQPYYEIKTTVDTLVLPDKIYLSIALKERDNKGKIGVEELEKKMFSVFHKLGIDIESQLTVYGMVSNFRKYFLKNKDIQKSKSFELWVKDVSMMAKVMQGLEEVAISNITLRKTEYEKMDSLKLILKKRTLRKAINQANEVLKVAGMKTGKILFISDISFPNRFRGELEEVAVLGYSSPKRKFNYEPENINFKKIKVSISLLVKIAIE